MLYENTLLAEIVIITYCQITPPTSYSLSHLFISFPSRLTFLFFSLTHIFHLIHWIIDKKSVKI
jgi:hypothetical protein